MYFSKLFHMFVQITEDICPTCKMVADFWWHELYCLRSLVAHGIQIVLPFFPIDICPNYICLDFQMYLSKLLKIFVRLRSLVAPGIKIAKLSLQLPLAE